MKTKEQLQAEIIEKQKEIIRAYNEYSEKLLEGFNNEIGGVDYPANEDAWIEKLESELSALTTALEKEGEESNSGSLPLASGTVTKTREPLPTYHNKCDLCGEIFWTKDAFNNKCPECGREGWQSNDR